jgi:ParB-like chromosome segregation protein Spo0J
MEAKSVKITELKEYPRNARIGDVKALADSLLTNGQYRPIVVQKSTQYVLAGNHLLKAAQQIGWDKLDVVYVDVDDLAAKRIVLSDNRTAELGSYDDSLLSELLAGLSDFDGTGYTIDDLDDLIASVEEAEYNANPSEEALALPELNSNVRSQTSLSDLKDMYADRARRQILLEYSNAQYIWVIEHLGKVRQKLNIDSNTGLLLHYLIRETGETPPDEPVAKS